MRKAALLTSAVMAVGGTAGVAYAAVTKTQSLKVTTSSAAGTKTSPKRISLDVTVGTKAVNQAESGTFASTSATIFFDKNLKFNNSKFPNCTTTKVAAGTCPAASKVGSGSASADVGAGGGIKPTFKITAFNAANGKLILQLKGEGGFSDQEKVLVGTLKSATGKYGKKLVVPIPLNVQQPVPGLKATITKFQTKINARYRGRNYVESIGCTRSKYSFRGDFKFDDGTAINGVTATSRCSL